MITANEMEQEISKEIQSIEASLLDRQSRIEELEGMLKNEIALRDDALRVRLAKVAALAALHQEKFPSQWNF